MTVHVDKDGAMVITQNPTLAPAMQKSKYEPKVQEADVSVSSDTVKDLSLIHIYTGTHDTGIRSGDCSVKGL